MGFHGHPWVSVENMASHPSSPDRQVWVEEGSMSSVAFVASSCGRC